MNERKTRLNSITSELGEIEDKYHTVAVRENDDPTKNISALFVETTCIIKDKDKKEEVKTEPIIHSLN